jgi:serine/threonine protein kinase
VRTGSVGSDFIGPYRVVRHLSVAGSVQSHLAREDGPAGFPREVVLKVVPKASGEGAADIEELTQEVTACAMLTHPSIVRTRHFFEIEGALVLVLEHVDGIALAALLADQTAKGKRVLSDDAVFHVGAAMCDALAHAHALDDETTTRPPIIHRAVNPSNVLLARDGTVKLDGFGFAKILGGVATESTTGSFRWTPAYMAPEQVTPQPATPKIDVYSTGLILWELLAGRPPTIFPQDPYAIDATLRAVATRQPPSLATFRSDLPRGLVLAVDAALVSAPEKRTIGCADIARWLRKSGRLEAGKRELREYVIRAQAAGATALPSLPPRTPLPPPDRHLTLHEHGVPRLPEIEALATPFEPAQTGSVWRRFLDRSSFTRRFVAPTRWPRYPALALWVVLGLCLVGVTAKVVFFRAAKPASSMQAPTAEATQAPHEDDPEAAPATSTASSSEPAPADDFSDELKRRGLGYLTVHSSAQHANVYINLKPRGKVEEKLTVHCGNQFVSIGLPASHGDEPMWLAPGKMMFVPCGGPLETTMDPRALRTR